MEKTFKRLGMLLLTLCVFFASPCAFSAHTWSFEVDGIAYYITSEQTVEVTNYQDGHKHKEHVEIPETVVNDSKTYLVTSINHHAFYECSKLTSVTIGNSVITIEDYAFLGCDNLASVSIGNSVTTIGHNAFEGCTSLASVNIPNSVTTIGISAFEDCTSLASVNIPNSVTTIGIGAFEDCTSLASVNIPNSVTTIGARAFSYCTSLTSVSIGNSVTTIGERAFYDCTSLTSVYSHAIEPPVCGGYDGVFDSNTQNNGCLYVPHIPLDTKEKYRTAEEWRDFYNIVAVDYSGIGEVVSAAGNIAVTGATGCIEVKNAPAGSVLQVYDLQGALVRKTTAHTVGNLPQGTYVVCIGGQSFKVAVD